MESRWAGAELHRLITQELLAYSGESEARVRIDGRAVMLEPSTAQTAAISLHELATNAAKYGSLSAASSRVEISLVAYGGRKTPFVLDRVGGDGRHATHVPQVRHMHYGKYDRPAQGEVRFDWPEQRRACEIALPLAKLCHHDRIARTDMIEDTA